MDDLRGDKISKVDITEDGKLEVTTSYSRKTESGEILTETSVYTTENTVLPEFKAGYTKTLSPEDEASVSIYKTPNSKE